MMGEDNLMVMMYTNNCKPGNVCLEAQTHQGKFNQLGGGGGGAGGCNHSHIACLKYSPVH
jgi:hypothetical protein